MLHTIPFRSFAGEICALGETYSYPPLFTWGERLQDAVEMFDLEKISHHLDTYDDLKAAIGEIA